ncbi:chorismate synthase [Candidatus Bathyarchaeota archaeon RBG_13_38_9]|nr:MAG: chorismate synthase [Candidatus Bathyarchaeota archaeon RBG_13_38_9]
MQGNTFGRMFRVTTCGESYGIGEGSGLAVIVDGVPPGMVLTDEMIQKDMDKRRPGQGKLDSPRKETDQVHIFAGVGQDGVTTGAPVGMIVYNVDTQKVHIDQYYEYKDLIRPGHAEYTFFLKYGEAADWCGAGRASGRETVGRVAAGALAKLILAREKVEVIAYSVECMGIQAREMTFDEAKKNYRKNEINCPDLEAADEMIKKVMEIKEEGDTAGGVIKLIIHNIPAGLGEPVFDKFSAMLSHAIMSIGAVKGIELGAGFKCGKMKGSDFNDHPYLEGGKVKFRTNNSGGVLGGITNGEDIEVRVAIKPTPTVSVEQPSIDMNKMKEEKLSPITRRDPTLLGRIYAVIEAMAAITTVDALFMDRGWEGMSKLDKKWTDLKRK